MSNRQLDGVEIYKLGAYVEVAAVPARIIGVQIWEGGRVAYNVAFWDGRERKVECVEPCEIASRDLPTTRIGFQSV